MSDPAGCMACNAGEVGAFLRANNFDPARLVPVPETSHTWADVLRPCPNCGATFLMLPVTKEPK